MTAFLFGAPLSVLAIAAFTATDRLRYLRDEVSSRSESARDLTGSWMIRIKPDPASGAPAVVNLAVMTRDGQVINGNNLGLVSLGEWQRLGADSFGITILGQEDSDGQEVRFKVRSVVTVGQDEQTFDGPFQTEVFDVDGNLLNSIPGTVQAERIHLQPLSEPPRWP